MNETREIPLNRGLTATVSLVDYAILSRYHWYANESGGNWYAMTHAIKTEHGSPSLMHRLIPCEGTGPEVIHKDGNTLHNARHNLIRGTRADTIHAQRLSKRNTSGYKGVSRSPKGPRWRASICINRRRIHLGTFESPEEAGRAYDLAAMEYFGRFARLNFPRPGYGGAHALEASGD